MVGLQSEVVQGGTCVDRVSIGKMKNDKGENKWSETTKFFYYYHHDDAEYSIDYYYQLDVFFKLQQSPRSRVTGK